MIITGISMRYQDAVCESIKTAAYTLQDQVPFAYRVAQVKDITSGKKYVYLRIDASQHVQPDDAVTLLQGIQKEARVPSLAARLVGDDGEREMVYL